MDKHLICGDNLQILTKNKDLFFNNIDLIYLDPPFNSKRDYSNINNLTKQREFVFTDNFRDINYADEFELLSDLNLNLYNFLKIIEKTFNNQNESLVSYLVHLSIRIYYLKKLLKQTGSIYLHCDHSASHYLKIIMDYIFGINNFRNEIVWKITSAKNNCSKKYPNNADSILFYTNSKDYTFNPQYKEYSKENIKTFNKKDERGYYKLVNLTAPNMTNFYNFGYGEKLSKRGYGYSTEKILKMIEDGEVIPEKGKILKRKFYLENSKGISTDNIWNDIYNVVGNSKEKLEYPTQKPEALLERIIKASSNEGDLILDPYLGSGTTGSVCQKLNRGFIGIDLNPNSIDMVKERLIKGGAKIDEDLFVY